MTYTVNPIHQYLSNVAPFEHLPTDALQTLADKSQMLRYRMGQPILRRETMPHQSGFNSRGPGALAGI